MQDQSTKNSPINKKLITLTPGDPSGIGLDLVCQIAQSPTHKNLLKDLLIITDPTVLNSRAKLLNIKLPNLNIHPIKFNSKVIAGKPNPQNSAAILEALDIATQLCLNNSTSALVTGPVNKTTINQAGINFSGHTGYLGQLCNKYNTQNNKIIMMFAYKNLKLALSTVHIPLNQVPKTCTQAHTQDTLETIITSLEHDFAIKNPKIAVCGLNPHAGEHGYLGTEEIDHITPAIKNIKIKYPNVQLIGPLSADTILHSAQQQHCDLILSQYHDQLLPAFKAISFGEAVNFSMGLPIIRTSVDHGTAESLAGTLKTNPNSLIAAIKLAQQITYTHNLNIKDIKNINKNSTNSDQIKLENIYES